MSRVALLPAVVALATLLGCGPSRATAVQVDADAALAAARDVGAAQRAPYEWTKAEAFLRESKLQAGRADFENAVILAEKALEEANKARAKALSDPAPTPAPVVAAEGAL